jgi:hypothetical protein
MKGRVFNFHGREATFAIGDRFRAVAARRMLTDIEPLG